MASERFRKTIERMRARDAGRRWTRAGIRLEMLDRTDFRSLEGPMTGPERMDYARAVAWREAQP